MEARIGGAARGQPPSAPDDAGTAKKRVIVYLLLALALLSGAIATPRFDFRIGPELHTVLEAIATVLALVIGALALVRYYSRKRTTYLFLGTGFLATGFLDGYHATITAPFINSPTDAAFPDLLVWTWIASRVFLSLFLFVSWLSWLQYERDATSRRGRRENEDNSVFMTAGVLTLVIFVFFLRVPLAGAYHADFLTPRPAEVVPGIFFVLALAGYLRKGEWKTDAFEHWLVIALILSVATHLGYLTFSSEPFDAETLVAHSLKIASYLALLTGLLTSVYVTFRKEEESAAFVMKANADLAREVEVRRAAEISFQEGEERLQDFLDSASDLILSTDAQGRIIYANRAWRKTLGYESAVERGMNILSLVPAESRDTFRRIMERVYRGEVLSDYEIVFLAESGEPIICSGSSNCRFEEGRPVATRNIFRNVTDERRAAEELARSQANMQALFESTGDAIWSVDRNHRLLTFNTAFALTAEAISGSVPRTGDPTTSFILPKDHDWFAGCFDRALAGNRFTAVREENVSGHSRFYELFFNPIETEAGIGGVVVFSKDITQRRKVEEALRKAKQDSEDANRTKSQFMANMSHELRTPLNSVIGFANILLKNRSGRLEPKEEGFLERILANGKHLLSLINEILDLSKIEAGKMELEIESVDLSQLVRETLAQLEGQVQGKPVLLLGDFPENFAPFLTDPGKLRQVIINLVGNALKFTESGEVVVRVEGTPGRGVAERILVRDTGVGIPPDRLEAVFEAFQQADGSTTRRFGGTGLGLTISRSLSQLMGYRITVDSKVGVGSTFTIHLSPPAATPHQGGTGDLAVSPEARWTPALLDPSRDLHGKRILVVDDEADSRTLLQHLLEEFGCTVFTAEDGIEGIDEARKHRPDLITVDLMMPRMSGWEMLKVLRDDAHLRETPTVVVSIIPEKGSSQTLGDVDVVSKPVDRDELIRTLRRHLAKSAGRVLIVDDNADTRAILQRYLRDAGLSVFTANHGEAAIEFLRRSRVDLILLDLLMPGIDGFATLERIRSGGTSRNTPVYVLTAKELTPEEKEKIAQSTEGVILKDGDVEKRLGEVFERYFGAKSEPTLAGGGE